MGTADCVPLARHTVGANVHVPANTTVVEISSRGTFANVIHDGAVEDFSSCQQTGSLRVTLRVSGCERERCCEVSRSL
jgi:hypothetical protein